MLRAIRKWWGRREFERLASSQVWYFLNFGTVEPGQPFSQEWIGHYFPEVREWVRRCYDDNEGATKTGLLVAHRILLTTIEAMSAVDRDKVKQELEHWARDPQGVRGNPTPLGAAVRLFYANADMQVATKQLDGHLVDIVCKDVVQALAGNLDARDRTFQRLAAKYDELTGDNLGRFLEKPSQP